MKDIHKKRNRNETDDIFTFPISPLVWLFFFLNEHTKHQFSLHNHRIKYHHRPVVIGPDDFRLSWTSSRHFSKFLSTLKKQEKKRLFTWPFSERKHFFFFFEVGCKSLLRHVFFFLSFFSSVAKMTSLMAATVRDRNRTHTWSRVIFSRRPITKAPQKNKMK